MNETQRFAARAALAPGLATLAVALFAPAQPFLAILVAFLLLARPLALADIPACLVAAWSGIFLGIVAISLFPQQPWLLFPAFAGGIILTIRLTRRTGNPTLGMLAAVGICAALPAGLIHPEQVLHAGWDHGANLTIGILAAWLSFAVFPAPSAPVTTNPIFSPQADFLIALTVVAAAWIAVVVAPASSVVLVIAALTTAWSLGQPGLPPHLPYKTAGAVLGAILGIAFDSIVAGSGNSLTVFLVALMAIFAALAWCTRRWSAQAACFTQCCAMFSVAAPMIPAPDTSLAAMGSRIAAILIGFGTAAAMYGLINLSVIRTNENKEFIS